VSRADERHDPASERAHFEALAARGTLYWAERTAAGRRRREIRAARLLAAAALGDGGAARRVLEVGCGLGDYSRPLARLSGARLVCLDVTPALVRRLAAAAPANVRALAGDVEALPFPDGAFDVVLGNAVLHHLDLGRAIPEMTRVLRPGGRLCFAEPNLLNPQVLLERSLPFFGRWLDNSPDETAFVRWRLRRRLAEHGLEAVTVRPFDFLYPATPERLIAAVERLGRVLEATPLVAEIAGSLLVAARRPGPS
jgi:SAM-dependent methyltransferase